MTRVQLSSCAIDSQVLIGITFLQYCRGSLARRCAFDIIRAIEFAASKDFISLKP